MIFEHTKLENYNFNDKNAMKMVCNADRLRTDSMPSNIHELHSSFLISQKYSQQMYSNLSYPATDQSHNGNANDPNIRKSNLTEREISKTKIQLHNSVASLENIHGLNV